MRLPQATLDIPCHYEVIGERLEDPSHLLALGDDGRFYSLSLLDGQTESTELSDKWAIGTCELRETLSQMHSN